MAQITCECLHTFQGSVFHSGIKLILGLIKNFFCVCVMMVCAQMDEYTNDELMKFLQHTIEFLWGICDSKLLRSFLFGCLFDECRVLKFKLHEFEFH